MYYDNTIKNIGDFKELTSDFFTTCQLLSDASCRAKIFPFKSFSLAVTSMSMLTKSTIKS